MDNELVLVDVPLGDKFGGSAQFEVAVSDVAGLTAGGAVVLASDSDGSRLTATGFTLSSAIDSVMPALRTILAQLRSGLHAPDEIGMEIGLKIGGEAGVIFAKASTEGSVKVSMTWRREARGGDAGEMGGTQHDHHDKPAGTT